MKRGSRFIILTEYDPVNNLIAQYFHPFGCTTVGL